MQPFVHLHVHSQYSFLDGADTCSTLVARAAECGMSAIAITDHNNVSAAVELSKAAAKYGIKPIHGVEVSMSDGSHLTLLAQNPEGYANICRMLTEAHMSSPRREPRTNMETLTKYTEGVMALSGCNRRGKIPSLVTSSRFEDAKDTAENLTSIFGKENFYIELEHSLAPRALSLNAALAELAQEIGVGTVATNNVHYANKPRFEVHDALTCVRTLTTLDDIHPERRINAENYLKSADEMSELFAKYPEALANTNEIADKCSPGLDLSLRLFPKYQTPKGLSSAEYLVRLTREGAIAQYGKITPVIENRLSHELSIITALGFEDYFLVVWDIAQWAQSQGIRYAGRGSAADSAVAYCLKLTNVDSIARGLLFERFMSLERAQKPDIDIDFESEKRDDVANYIYRKYGDSHVASVCTFNTFQARSAVRDFGKALGFPPNDIDRIANILPHVPADAVRSALQRYPEARSEEIPKWQYELLFELCESVAGFPRHIGTHLGGLVISDQPLTCVTPLQMSAKGVAITQFDKNAIEDLGLIKLDILSLRTLSAVEHTVDMVRASGKGHDDFDYNGIPLDDDDTYKMLNSGETIGLFQLESPAQRALQTRLGADNIEDIVASVALIRPGPIQGNMVEPFIARRSGAEEIAYIHPKLEPILKKTYGVVLYQEQVIEIATTIAGFTPGEADRLRKAMTHFRSMREMEDIGRNFVAKAVANGVSPDVAETIFSYIVGYAGYGFCEAHAAAFADTAYKTAYLARHYPSEFYAALLSAQPMGFYPARTLLVEARRRGVEALPLDINHSKEKYSVEGTALRVGFMQVSGISSNLIHEILHARQDDGPFMSTLDFLCRIKANKTVVENLVLAGAFDSTDPNRKALFWNLGRLAEVAASHRTAIDAKKTSGQASLLDIKQTSTEVRKAIPSPYHSSDVSDAFRLPAAPQAYSGYSVVNLPDFSDWEKFKHETSVLGFCASRHAMEFFRPALMREGIWDSRKISSADQGQIVRVAGLVVRPHRPPTKSGKTVVFLSLEDEYGLTDVTVFDDVYQRQGAAIFKSPALIVTGTISRRGNGVSVIAKSIESLGEKCNR